MRGGLIVVLEKVKEAARASSVNIKTGEMTEFQGESTVDYVRVINADVFTTKLEELIADEKLNP